VRLLHSITLLLAVACTACGDSFGPRFWDPTPDTVVVYSLTRSELLGRPSAFDAVLLRRVLLESPGATNAWDFALTEDGTGFFMAPAGAFDGIDSRAGIATMGPGSLEELREAPRDTARFSAAPVAIEPGTIYVLRTRRESCAGFGTGVFYAKLEAIEIDAIAGSYRFAIVRNPLCNDRALVPPEDD
jgi:hypothetical protein